MKLIHLSDLHIGKRLNEYSLIEDQQYILNRIIDIAIKEKPFGVIIAGDVYDKAVPSAEAVRLFDDFLVRLSEREIKVFVISGNHDSPERLAFAGRIMNKSGVYISPVYNGRVEPLTFSDEYGKINIYLLPFVKPATVRHFFPNYEIETYTDAVRTAIQNMHINADERNIIVSHQFVTGASTSGSEELSVGGTENVSADEYLQFDYAALGHIHNPQSMCENKIRYSGTPLKYSFSEIKHQKTVTILDIGNKGDVNIKTIELMPLRDMFELKGEYELLVSKKYYENIKKDDYVNIILTDEDIIPEALGRLRAVYPNIMKLSYDNTRTRSINGNISAEHAKGKTPYDFFEELYKKQNGVSLNDDEKEYVTKMISQITEENI